jgi:hypothetical protein
MPVILTITARVKDWQALQKLNNEIILVKVRSIRAVHYQIYRNSNDASQALLWIELPDHDDVGEMREAVIEQFGTLSKVSLIDDRMWEPTDCEAVGVDR